MISVLLPVRNAAAGLPAALDSLLGQTLGDFEIVAINDGSDDGGATQAVLEAYARRDARLRVLHRPHGGIVAALTAGLAAARGDAIARMDADDVCHPRRLERQAAFLDAHPDIGLVSCLAAFGGDPEAARGYKAHLDWANGQATPEAIRLGIFRESPLPHPTVMFRAELPGRFGGYRQGPFPEDYELWLRWLEAGVAMAKLPEALLVWNDPPGRLSRTDPRYDAEAFHRIKAGYLARHLARINPHHPEVLVVGAGRPTRRRAEQLLAHGVVIKAWLDIDPRKIGRVLGGRPVIALEAVPPPSACFVVPYVASRGATDILSRFLSQRGFVLGRSFLPAA
ncbi:MAG: glycosyltransferase [Solidesulfovibrio sp. DCME]|uniref:glycosyltransferase family 2 protein n=1 Tax=Solidesulfovibrio sp. DCME TaxID=3447380 RepID=UPI003D0FEADA